MGLEYRSFLWRRCNAAPLMLATERATPGMLLETRFQILEELLNLPPIFEREDGFAW